MVFRKMFGLFFMLLLLFGFLGLINNNRQNTYMQGYIAGQQSVVTSGDGSITAVSPPTSPTQLTDTHRFSFFGGLLKFFVFFFGFIFFIKITGMLIGGKHRRRHKGWHHAHHWGNWQKQGHKPPWYDTDDADEPIMKA